MPIKGCHLEEGIDLSSEVVPGYELDLNKPMMPKHKPAILWYTRGLVQWLLIRYGLQLVWKT